MLDEAWKCKKASHNVEVACVNRFAQLAISDDCVIGSSDDGELLCQNVRGNKCERKLKVGTWNFSGLCSQRKQQEVSDILKKLGMDIVAGQESWDKVESAVVVSGYKWFGKLRKVKKSVRGEVGVGFLVREYLVEEVEFISKVCYEES